MGYSYVKKMTLKPEKERGFSTFLVALIAATAVFLPFMLIDDGYFLFYGDFNVQQIPFYQMCHKAVREGQFGWNWLTDLGTNFIGSYTYYTLGSPFFWLTLPFPNWMVPYLMGPLLILKFACAALTAYLFIRRFTKTPAAAQLGGLLYAFSGFSVYNVFFNQFHESIIVFPLLMLSLELLLTENRRGVFAFCVFLAAATNYFFFFGMVVFVLIYFIIRVTSKAVKLTFGRFMAIAFESLLGFLLSAFIMLPTVLAVSGVPRVGNILSGWNAVMYGKEQIYLNIIECFFFPPDLPARPVFFPSANVKWSSLGGWLPLFGMTGVFAYCTAKKGSWLKRLICTSFVFSMFPILNSAFSAFNTSYYARWFYMPILFMCLATSMALEDREIQWTSSIGWSAFITLAFFVVIGFFPQKDENGAVTFGLYTNNTDSVYRLRFFITCGIALISIIGVIFLINVLKRQKKSFWNTAICLVLAVSVGYSSYYISEGKTHSYSTADVMIPLIEDSITLPDNSDNYRVDTYGCPDNTGMFLELPCINAFHSIVPRSVTEFYEYVGESRSVASRPSVKNYAIRDLLSVRFVINRKNSSDKFENDGETLMDGYNLYGESENYLFYENENYIPYGFSYDYYMSREFCDSYPEGERAELMLKAVLLSDEQIAKYSSIMTDIEILEDNTAVTFDNEQISADCDILKSTSASDFETSSYGFSATVTRNKKSLVFFSVPYESGWSVTVNGKPAEVENVNIGFMAVCVDAGTSRIEFKYEVPGLVNGIKISIVSMVLFLAYLLICLIVKHRNGSGQLEYPEGDELMKKWEQYDIDDANGELNEEEVEFTLDDIAESLENSYPTNYNKEFTDGFTVNKNFLNKP